MEAPQLSLLAAATGARAAGRPLTGQRLEGRPRPACGSPGRLLGLSQWRAWSVPPRIRISAHTDWYGDASTGFERANPRNRPYLLDGVTTVVG